MKLRIILLSWEFPPRIIGGISRHIEGLGRALANLKNEVHIVTLDFPQTPAYEHSEGLHIHRVPVEVVTSSFHNWVLLFNHFFEKKVGYIASKFGQPDIIHVHDWLTVPAGVAVKHLMRKPLLMTFHSTEVMRSPKPSDAESDMVRGLEWWGSYEATRVITVSKYMKSHIVSVFNLPPNKVEVVYNAVDVSKFTLPVDVDAVRKKWGIIPGESLVTAVGRLTWQKGFDNLIRAFPRILKSQPKTRLMVMGDGYQRRELEELSHATGVRDRVIFTGFVSDSELILALKSSDVIVVPSRYEPFGVIALEAMAVGVPVVVSGVEGLAEIVEHGKDGLSVNPNDTADIAQAVTRILSDKALAHALSSNATEKVKTFRWDQVAEITARVYLKAMEEVRFE